MRGWLVVALFGLLAVAVAAESHAADSPWTRYYASHHPLSLELPPTWRLETLRQGVVLLAQDDETGASMYVYADPAPASAKWFATDRAGAAREYRALDPKASVRFRMTKLPVGTTLEVIAELTAEQGSPPEPLSVRDYDVFHGGVGYIVVYQGPPKEDAVDLPVFERSAQTIRFGS
jgi:hypothetical protein